MYLFVPNYCGGKGGGGAKEMQRGNLSRFRKMGWGIFRSVSYNNERNLRFFSPNLQFDIPLSPLQLTPKEYASWYYVLPKRKVRFRKELQRSEGDIVNLSFTNLEFSSIHSVICIK